MEIEIRVLVEFKAAGNLFFISLILNRLQSHGMVRQLTCAFI